MRETPPPSDSLSGRVATQIRVIRVPVDLEVAHAIIEACLQDAWTELAITTAVRDLVAIRQATAVLDALEELGNALDDVEDDEHLDQLLRRFGVTAMPPESIEESQGDAKEFPEIVDQLPLVTEQAQKIAIAARVSTELTRNSTLLKLLQSDAPAAEKDRAITMERTSTSALVDSLSFREGVNAVIQRVTVLANTPEGLELLSACDRSTLFELQNPVILLGFMASESISAINDRARLRTMRMLVGDGGVSDYHQIVRLVNNINGIGELEPEKREQLSAAVIRELLSIAIMDTMEDQEMPLRLNSDVVIGEEEGKTRVRDGDVINAMHYGDHHAIFEDLSPAVDAVFSAMRDLNRPLYEETIERLVGRNISVLDGNWGSHILARDSDSTTRFETAAKETFLATGVSDGKSLSTRAIRSAVLASLQVRRELARAAGAQLTIGGQIDVPADWESQLGGDVER